MTPVEAELAVTVPPGCPEGHVLHYPGAGDELTAGDQDVEVVVHSLPHGRFSRDGPDLRLTVRVTLAEALCGVDLVLPMLVGPDVDIFLADIRPGTVHEIPGRGLPAEHGAVGSVFVAFEIVFPPPLSRETRAHVFPLLQPGTHG